MCLLLFNGTAEDPAEKRASDKIICELWTGQTGARSLCARWFDTDDTAKQKQQHSNYLQICFWEKLKKLRQRPSQSCFHHRTLHRYQKGTANSQRSRSRFFFYEFSFACITSHSMHRVLCAFTQPYSQPIRGYHLSPDLCCYCPCIYLTLSVDYALSACLWKLTEAKNYTLRAGGKRNSLLCFHLGFGMAQRVSENQPVETKPAITFPAPQRSHLAV